MKSTGELEREAADALRPIVEHALAELGLGHTKARPLMRQIAEAYMKGRAEEINLSADEANCAPSAEGIAIALALEDTRAIPTAGRTAWRTWTGSEGVGRRVDPRRSPRPGG